MQGFAYAFPLSPTCAHLTAPAKRVSLPSDNIGKNANMATAHPPGNISGNNFGKKRQRYRQHSGNNSGNNSGNISDIFTPPNSCAIPMLSGDHRLAPATFRQYFRQYFRQQCTRPHHHFVSLNLLSPKRSPLVPRAAILRAGEHSMRYVRQTIREHAAGVWNLLPQGAAICVSRDASRMAPEMRAAVVAIYQQAADSPTPMPCSPGSLPPTTPS